jgi:hypothetical protein
VKLDISNDMKQKLLIAGVAVLLIAGGLWLAQPGGSSDDSSDDERSLAASGAASTNLPARQRSGPGPNEADQTRKFRDFTPEQRVEFARKGLGPGG